MARGYYIDEESMLEHPVGDSKSCKYYEKQSDTPVQCTEPCSTADYYPRNKEFIDNASSIEKAIVEDHSILNFEHGCAENIIIKVPKAQTAITGIKFHDAFETFQICCEELKEKNPDNRQHEQACIHTFQYQTGHFYRTADRSFIRALLSRFTFICLPNNLPLRCSDIASVTDLKIRKLDCILFFNLTHMMFKRQVALYHMKPFKTDAYSVCFGCPMQNRIGFINDEKQMFISSYITNKALNFKQRIEFVLKGTNIPSRIKESLSDAEEVYRTRNLRTFQFIMGKLAFLLEVKTYCASFSYGFQALFIIHCLLTSLLNVMSLVNLRNTIRRHRILLSIVYVISNDNSMKNKEKSVRCFKKNRNFKMISLIGLEETMRVKSKWSRIEILHDKEFFDFRKVPFSNEIITVFPIYGDMSNEMHRLGTLSTFPTSSCPSLIRLARSGFYYEGNGTELICFSCKVRYDKWTFSSIPDNVHFDISPQCEHLKLIYSENNVSKLNVSSELPRPKHDAVSQGANSATGSVIESDHNPQTTTSVPQLLITASHNPVSWKSYDSGYSSSSYSSKGSRRLGLNSSLATSASRDSGIYSSSGSSGDSGLGKSGLSGGLSSGNSGLASTSGLPSGMTQGAHSNPAPRNVPTEKYPEFKSIEKRRASYEDWPSNLQFLHPLDLAECGFFYSKFGDCVRCFHCGIGLRNWESDDNPWVEHARWSKNCPYLIQKKGQEFIDSVLKIIGLQTDAEIERQKSGGNNESERENKAATSDPIKHPAAQYVIKEKIFGEIQEKTVKRAMNQLLQDQDWDNITNDSLVNILLEKKDQWEFPEPKPSTSDTSKAQASASGTSGNREAISEDPEAIQKENETLKDLYTCKICFDEKVGITFVPCGHLVTCKNCSPKIRKCPLCRTYIRGTIKTTI